MKLPDLNVLLYARNSAMPEHDRARQWIEEALSGHETTAFGTVVLLGFVRLATNPRVFEAALSGAAALNQVHAWLTAPCARMIHPGPSHWQILGQLLEQSGTAGSLTTDAHLAALAIEHGATLTSFDGDFHRFHALSLEYLG